MANSERKNIAIIDYGMGNIRSVAKAVSRSGHTGIITSDINVLQKSNYIILPGVGHFKKGMENLNKAGISAFLKDIVQNQEIKLLGICLGMQLLSEYSEEGDSEGLGIIRAVTKKFPELSNKRLKIPHMGWNQVDFNSNELLKNIEPNPYFYFVHSYYVESKDPDIVLGQTEYGIQFTSAIQYKNIIGFQFHPEKSHQTGIQLIKNFIDL